MALPTLIGNFLTPFIMDRMGRKVALYALTVPIIVGWLFIAAATNFQVLEALEIHEYSKKNGYIALHYPYLASL